MIYRAWCFLCFHVWMRIPVRWNASRPALRILPYAGDYAYREPQP